jgi:hypothetical protein
VEISGAILPSRRSWAPTDLPRGEMFAISGGAPEGCETGEQDPVFAADLVPRQPRFTQGDVCAAIRLWTP